MQRPMVDSFVVLCVLVLWQKDFCFMEISVSMLLSCVRRNQPELCSTLLPIGLPSSFRFIYTHHICYCAACKSL